MTDIRLTIASCNLQNLNEHSAFHKIDNFIHALQQELSLPDIVALQEIGSEAIDHEGFAVANVASTMLENIYEKTGVLYQYIDIPPLQNSTGGAQNFNIRPAFLLKSDIKLLHKTEIGSAEPAFIGSEADCFKASRNPLLITIEKNKKRLTLINCHLKSQNSKTNQEKKLAKKQRNQQAEIIKNYCQTELAKKSPLIILGDFNDTPNSDTLRILSQEQFISIWSKYNGRAYTTKHRNCPVVIDYILLTSNILFSEPQIHHINTNLKHPQRFSDHDPISVEIYL